VPRRILFATIVGYAVLAYLTVRLFVAALTTSATR
jgi:hypothetical protein